jgi:hypothetical protein
MEFVVGEVVEREMLEKRNRNIPLILLFGSKG